MFNHLRSVMQLQHLTQRGGKAKYRRKQGCCRKSPATYDAVGSAAGQGHNKRTDKSLHQGGKGGRGYRDV